MAIFTVPDMTCDGCIKAIKNALHHTDPGAIIVADLATHQVRVTSSVAEFDLADAVREAGFTVLAM